MKKLCEPIPFSNSEEAKRLRQLIAERARAPLPPEEPEEVEVSGLSESVESDFTFDNIIDPAELEAGLIKYMSE